MKFLNLIRFVLVALLLPANVHAQVQECDRLAASPHDPQKQTAGLSFDKINPNLAITACKKATEDNPQVARLWFQYGRALEKGNRLPDAIYAYQAAAKLKSGAANNNIGELYRDGKGFQKDLNKAKEYFTLAANLNSPEGRANLLKLQPIQKTVNENVRVTNPETTATSTQTNSGAQYLGLRLLGLVPSDPTFTPMPQEIAKELKECKFFEDPALNLTQAQGCEIQDVAPTYKLRPKEQLSISADSPRCCLGAVTISTNQSTYEKTLDLFTGIPGVKKTEVQCSDIESSASDRKEFFSISQDGKNLFAIREHTYGGSGGNTTETTIYYGLPSVDCKRLAKLEELEMEKTQKANLARAQNSVTATSNARVNDSQSRLDSASPQREIVGNFSCLYAYAYSEVTGIPVEIRNKFTYVYKLSGRSGTMNASNGQTNALSLTKVNLVNGETQFWFEQLSSGGLRIEHRIAQSKSGAYSAVVLVFKNTTVPLMTIGECQKSR